MSDCSSVKETTSNAQSATGCKPKANKPQSPCKKKGARDFGNKAAPVQLVVQAAPPVAKEKPKAEKPKPTLTTGDIYRALQQCVGNVSSLYLILPIKVLGLDTPAVVRDHPYPDFVPLVYRFDYTICSEEYAKQRSPVILATRTEIHFGRELDSVDVIIESELILRCFNQSTVRDYHTLIDSIFMTVNRSLGDSVKPDFDVNTKLEAIAALYLFRHPNLTTSFSLFSRILSQYKPQVPGVYALGGNNTPDFGDSPVEFKWKKPADPVRQNYVLRLMVPELKGYVFPLYAPARTPAEFLKAAAKRLKSPPRITHIINGTEWDEPAVRRLLSQVSSRLIMHFVPQFQAVKPLSQGEVLAACYEKAVERFQSQQEIDDYVEGARIAMQEGENSPLFLRMLDLCTEIGVFVKDETYDKFAPLRYIMCPQVAARGFCHALLMNVQRRLFGVDQQTQNPHCVKHMTEQERFDYVHNLFGNCAVANGDISSMESSVTQRHMENIELPWFCACANPEDIPKIVALWDRYMHRVYHVSCSEFEFFLEPMRLSGQEHTSCGNWVVNFTWICAIVFMLSGSLPDLNKFRILVEGDDSLYTRSVPLENGNEYVIQPEEFIKAAECLGTKQKLMTYACVDDASFCGIRLKPGVVREPNGKTHPDDVFDYDTDFVLSKILWKAGYDRSTAKHDREICFASILSYLPRSAGNHELYDALYWLAKKIQPTLRQTQSKHFHNIWLHTFYRGEIENIPSVPTTLEDYCDKFNLPKIDFEPSYTPRVFTVPGENRYNMEIVEISGPSVSSTWDSVLQYFRKPESKAEVVTDTSNECMIHAMHDYLVRTQQIMDDQPARDYDIFKTTRFNGNLMPTMTESIERLAPGEHMVVDTEFGVEEISRAPNGVVSRTPVSTAVLPRIVVRDNVFGDKAHARLIAPVAPPEERRIGYISKKVFIYPLILALVALVLYFYSNIALFTVSVWGVPIYCFWKIGQQVWARFISKWAEKKFKDKAALIKPIGVVLGATYLGRMWWWLLVFGFIGFLVWWFWEYVKWAFSQFLRLLGWLFSWIVRFFVWAGPTFTGIFTVCCLFGMVGLAFVIVF